MHHNQEIQGQRDWPDPAEPCHDFYDQHGKRRLATLPDDTTKKAAKTRLREIEESVGKGTFLSAKKVPFFKEVAEEWSEYKKPNLRITTHDVMAGHLRKHFFENGCLKKLRLFHHGIAAFCAFSLLLV